MKGDPSIILGGSGSSTILHQNQNPIIFRRNKIERLDWRKIASLDLEKLIQDSDIETLQEILPDIAFCKAEVEFDNERTDPGFRKVFQLAQLIVEFLLYNQTFTHEKLVQFEERCKELTEKNTNYMGELKSLKEKLIDAKKELKKRKAMLASSQNEVMGANKDEFDQCPYCSKKFIASVYLFSHMQRRHQGLPLHPMFTAITHSKSAQNLADFKIIQQQLQMSNKENHYNLDSQTKYTQTVISSMTPALIENSNGGETYGGKRTGMHAVNDIMEKYLQEKTTAGEALENLLPSPELNLKEMVTISSRRNSLQKSDRNITRIKENLESQWKILAERIHQTGIQELKGVLMTEMQKMQEIIASTVSINESKIIQEKTEKESPSTAIIEKVEEHFQKQENELECLRQNLQNKMECDLVSIEGKLDCQERFWRSKLRQVEEEYHFQISKLREDFQSSISKLPQAQPIPTVDERLENVSEQLVIPLESNSAVEIPVRQPPSPLPSMRYGGHEYQSPGNITHKPPMSPRRSPAKHKSPEKLLTPAKPQEHNEQEIPPVAKPRVLKTDVTESNLITPKVKAALAKINNTAFVAPPPLMTVLHHEYEEAQDRPDVVSDYSSSEISSTPSEERLKKQRNDKSTRNHPQPPNVNRNNDRFSQMTTVRRKVLEDVDKQMEELGLYPDANQLENSDAKRALSRLRHRRRKRGKLDQNFTKEREAVKEKAKYSATAETMKLDLQHPRMVKPKNPESMSPLVKLFSAVKHQGSDWKKKVALSIAKRRSTQRPVENTEKPKLKTFFWKKNPQKKEAKESESEEESETSSSEATSSDEPNMPMLTRSKPILVNESGRHSFKRKEKPVVSEVNESSKSESKQLPPKNLKSALNTESNNARIPPTLEKKPVGRDLLKNFESVVVPTVLNRQNQETELGSNTSKEVSGASSLVSGTETSETSESDDQSQSLREDDKGGHYVSLRPSPTTNHNKGEFGKSRSSNFTEYATSNNNQPRSPITVPAVNRSLSLTNRTRSDISSQKPTSPFVISQNRSAAWSTTSSDEKSQNSKQKARNSSQIYSSKQQQHFPNTNPGQTSIKSELEKKTAVWSSTPILPRSPRKSSFKSKSPRSSLNNSWDSG